MSLPVSGEQLVLLVLGGVGIPLTFKALHPNGYLSHGELAACMIAIAIWSQVVAWGPSLWKKRGGR